MPNVQTPFSKLAKIQMADIMAYFICILAEI